jgi:hypothetical protein
VEHAREDRTLAQRKTINAITGGSSLSLMLNAQLVGNVVQIIANDLRLRTDSQNIVAPAHVHLSMIDAECFYLDDNVSRLRLRLREAL